VAGRHLRYSYRFFTYQAQEQSMFFRSLALAVAASILPAAAPAEVIYDTFQFGADPTDAAPVGQVSGFDFQAAYPFDAEVDPNMVLESITLSLWTDVDVNTQNGDWLVRLRANNNQDQPGDVLEEWTLDNTAFPGQTTIHEFVSLARPSLVDGERYWVNVKTVPGSGFAAWNGSIQNTTDMFSARQGSLNPDWMAPGEPYMLALMTIEAPEPGQLLLVVSGATVLAACAFRQRRA
jgi:hypothetical protein